MIETLVTKGWDYHETDSERLASELEAADVSGLKTDVLLQLLNLSNHTIGEHLRDWQRAATLAERACSTTSQDQISEQVNIQLAIPQYMNNDISKAHRAEINAILNSENAMSTYLSVKALLANALASAERFEESFLLVETLNHFASTVDVDGPYIRSLAIANNNIASRLIDEAELTADAKKLMLESANSSLVYWKKCGTWENEERALYLVALAYNRLDQYDEALSYGERALEVIRENGEEKVDEAFIRLALANAHRGLDNPVKHEEELALADSIADEWNDPGMDKWYQEERVRSIA